MPTNHFRIGTWNLDRSGIRKRDRAESQIGKIMGLDADVWILTETHSSLSVHGYFSEASEMDSSFHFEGESCAAIWSRYPLQKIDTEDPLSTVCVEIQSPLGPILVYGTIITYAWDGVKEGEAKPWERHRNAVDQQTKEWKALQVQYPRHLRCIAGDFNMNLYGRHWYGVNDAREKVRLGLNEAGLACITMVDLEVPPHNLRHQTIDHICLSDNFKADITVEVWQGDNLSDHNGVLVDIGRGKCQSKEWL